MKSYRDFVLMSDMDGTLIGSGHRVSEKNKAAIRYFTAQGGSFAVATGRTQHNCASYMEGLAVNAPCILYNGAALYDWGARRFLETRGMRAGRMLPFLREALRRSPRLCVQVYTKDDLYVVTDASRDDATMIKERQTFTRAAMEDLSGMDWIKILICGDRQSLERCLETAGEIGIDNDTNHFYSSPVYLEFVGKSVSKGDMLSALMGFAPFAGKTCVAAGDYDNDAEMLRRADLGIAPANAVPAAKSAADRVGGSCDEDLIDEIVYQIIPELF